MDFKKSSSYNFLATAGLTSDYPTRRQIFVEEVIRDAHCNTTLIRKINYEEIYDYQKMLQLESLENAAQSNSSSYYDVNIEVGKCEANPLQITPFTSIYEETPMEIDSSIDGISHNYPVKYNSSDVRKRQNTNKKHAIAAPNESETYSTLFPVNGPSISKCSKSLLMFITLLMVLSVIIFIAGDQFIYVNRKFQLENIKKELNENVMQQEDAVKIIVQNFEQMYLWTEKVKVLPFVGTTGVGKTFTANIVKKHFFPHLVHEVDISHVTNLENQQSIMARLKICCCNLIIIDNLKAYDLSGLISFIKNLPTSHNLLIIPIFNIHNTVDGITFEINKDDFKLIRNDFEKSGLHYELVLFEVLNTSVIQEWLQKELYKRRIDEKRHDSLVKFLLNNNQVKYKGFKGLNSKLLLALDGS